jgi:ribokinase
MANIVVIGSSNTDMVVKTGKFPVPGETILGGEFFMFPGGKGANQAVAAARMDGNVVFICKTGNDIFGENAIEGFKKEGIEVSFIKQEANTASGVALITVDERGENTIVVAPGANDALLPRDIEMSLSAIKDADIILMQLEIPIKTVEFVISTALSLNKRIILNPAPARELSASLLRDLYLITPNETEAALLTGVKVTDVTSAGEAAHLLLKKEYTM